MTPPDPRTKSIVFHTLRRGFLDLLALRRRIESRMRTLPLDFNASVPSTTLHLRAWTRGLDGPPYALYWILIHPASRYFNSWLDQTIHNLEPRKRPFSYVSIHTPRDLDTAIHRGILDGYRPLVRGYHNLALALNGGHQIVSVALDSVRKLLSRKTLDPALQDESPDPPGELAPLHESAKTRTLMERLWVLETRLSRAVGELRHMVEHHHPNMVPPPYKLVLFEVPGPPFVRLGWKNADTGCVHNGLTDLEMRSLDFSPDDRRALSPYELVRRRLTRRLELEAVTAENLSNAIFPALERATPVLDQADTLPPLPEGHVTDRPYPGLGSRPAVHDEPVFGDLI
jgi:hypothetical protein